jgi:hypothetical protein
MDDLENKLESMSVPEVQVPQFRERLKHRLLDSFDAVRSAAKLKRLFAVAGIAAAVLLAVSAVFVARPSVPAAINARLTGTERPGIVKVLDWPLPEKPSVAKTVPKEDPMVVNMAAERELVEELLREVMKGGVTSPRIRDGEMYTIGRYTLSDDKEIFVMSSFPPRKARVTKTIY